jgi:LuxR family maltose regulon positive regulatory protein
MESRPSAGLSPRELEILELLARNFGNRRIARDLGISVHTVKWHIKEVYRKLDAGSRVEAVLIAFRDGILDGQALFTLQDLDGLAQKD